MRATRAILVRRRRARAPGATGWSTVPSRASRSQRRFADTHSPPVEEPAMTQGPPQPGRVTPTPRLSVAAPCFNEAEGIESVVAEWDGVLAHIPEATEIVLCNDGSTDGTAEVLERLRTRFPRLRVVHNP